MEKNTIMAIILSSIVLVGFMYVQTTFFPPPEPVAPRTSVQQPQSVVQAQNQAALSAVTSAIRNEAEQEVVAEENPVIETDLFRATFTNRGGDIISYELKDHRDGKVGVSMADNISAANRAYSVAFGGADSPAINDLFLVKKIDNHTIGFYKKFSINNTDGSKSTFTMVKQYSFKPDDYLFQLDIIIDGEDGMKSLDFGGAGYTLRTPPQIGPTYDQKNDRYETRTFMSFTKDKKKKQILGTGQLKTYDNSYSWTGVAGKYFTILVAPQGIPAEKAVYSTVFENPDYANAQVFVVRAPIIQQKVQDTYYIYAGPRTEGALGIYNNSADNAWKVSSLRLNDSLESSGVLYWLEAFLKWAMELCYKLIPNWGVSIIILTILLKIAFFPLTKKSSMSSLKMQELQPRMKELQNKFKDQPEKLNVEMGKLYKETGYNPLSGCLPLLIQFPLIFAMYNLFNNYFEFRGAMFIPGWIPDLSTGDSIYTFAFSIPFLGNHLRLLPVIYVISQLLFGKVTQTGAGQSNAQMKIMMYGMPLFFFFIFYNAPSGLILYWTVSNILQLIQQVIINKYMHMHVPVAKAPAISAKTKVPQKKKK